MDLDTIHILLTLLAGATILNGLFMIIGIGYIAFQLRNIWEAEMVLLGMFWDDDVEGIDVEVIKKSD